MYRLPYGQAEQHDYIVSLHKNIYIYYILYILFSVSVAFFAVHLAQGYNTLLA